MASHFLKPRLLEAKHPLSSGDIRSYANDLLPDNYPGFKVLSYLILIFPSGKTSQRAILSGFDPLYYPKNSRLNSLNRWHK
jgi:hypothetical protein